MNKGKLICFMGIDGSGKTTLSNLFMDKMQENEIEFSYLWCKFGSYNLLLSKLLNILSFLILKKDKKNSDFPGKAEIKKNTFSKIYMYFLLFIHYIDILIKVKLRILLGKNIVCDRYLTDTVVDLILEFDLTYEDALKLVNNLYFAPKPDIQFYINVPVDVAFERKKENSKAYLRSKEEIYAKYSAENRIIVLNGTKNLNELLFQIQEIYENW